MEFQPHKDYWDTPEAEVPSFPLLLHQEIAVLDEFVLGTAAAQIFCGHLANLPALIGEMMLAGELDPGLFRLDIPFSIGQGPITNAAQVESIRTKAATLWKRYRILLERQPDVAARNREPYLKAVDPRLLRNPNVAVKMVRSEGLDEAARSAAGMRLTHEAAQLDKLGHRNILRRYAFLQDEEHGPCLILEHVPGRTMERILRRREERKDGPMPLPAVAHVAYQVAQGLAHAHYRGVVHGDVRPANLLVQRGSTDDEESAKSQGIVKLLEFGFSQTVNEPPAPEDSTRLSGAMQHLAPEQFRDEPATPETDVYQLGTTLYVLTTGRLPYPDQSPEGFRRQILTDEPHPSRVHHHRPDVSPRFEAAIEGAREKDPAKRWPLAKVLEEIAQIYASRNFSVKDAPASSSVEELLGRVRMNASLNDFERAVESLELAATFMDSLPTDREAEIRKKFDDLSIRYQQNRIAVEAVRRLKEEHIEPVNRHFEALYDRYGKSEPLLTDEEKGLLDESGEVVRRSLVDTVIRHTQQVLQQLSEIDAELVGDSYHKLVERAAAQEEAFTDLMQRELKFGEDYLKQEATSL